MTKTEFLRRLSDALGALTAPERDAAMRYYSEYIEDAGPENAQAVIAGLGAPELVARQVIAEAGSPPHSGGTTRVGARTRRYPLWATPFVLFFGLILGLPLLIALLAVEFSLLIVAGVMTLVAYVLVMCAGVCMAAFFAGGALCAITAILLLPQHLPTALYALGCGIALLGLGGLLAAVLPAFARAVNGACAHLWRGPGRYAFALSRGAVRWVTKGGNAP